MEGAGGGGGDPSTSQEMSGKRGASALTAAPASKKQFTNNSDITSDVATTDTICEPKNNEINNMRDTTKDEEYKFRYSSAFLPPFVVHVQKRKEDGFCNLDSISFGSFLHKHKNQNFEKILRIKSVGRQKISVEFHTHQAANIFLDDVSLSKNGYTTFIPKYLASRMGVLRGIPLDMTEDDLLEHISTPRGFGKIIKIRRLTYKSIENGQNIWKPSRSIVVTVEGQELPSHVYLFFNRIAVETYVLPTVQCYKCCRFGHTKIQCRGKEVCYKCGSNHTGDKCSIEEECASCVNCGGRHTAVSVICPELARQKNIKKVMAENSLSYYEASLRFPRSKPAYSSLVSDNLCKIAPRNISPPRSPPRSVSGSPPQAPIRTQITLSPRKRIVQLPSIAKENNDRKRFLDMVKEMKSMLMAPNGNYPQPEDGCILKAAANTENFSKNESNGLFNLVSQLERFLSSGHFVSSPTSDNIIISQLDKISAESQLDNIYADRQPDNVYDFLSSQRKEIAEESE
jgi:hypothetical protein